MNKDIAISVKGVSKTFKIPHEKVSSIRGAVTGIFRDKSYEEFKALDNVSFEVKKGEFFGIIGRNGSGKSTLLKVLAGIYQADKGRVKVNGMISPFLELGIGFNPELSGRDNVYLNATVLGMTQKQIDEKFESIIAFSELERFIDQKLKNYSSGMQVRLAFSVSIHANRDILLMDEVLAVGDMNFQQKCLNEFNRYRNLGKTIILVTHDMKSVMEYCDRALLLQNGKVIRIGNPQAVSNEYLNQNTLNLKNESYEIIVDGQRVGKNIGFIQKVFFTNKDKKITNSFITAESMHIVIEYKTHPIIKDLCLGVSIYPASKKENIFSFEQKLSKRDGIVSLDLEKLNLNSGKYFISVGLTDIYGNWTHPYDLIEQQLSILVQNVNNHQSVGTQDYSSCYIPFLLKYENK